MNPDPQTGWRKHSKSKRFWSHAFTHAHKGVCYNARFRMVVLFEGEYIFLYIYIYISSSQQIGLKLETNRLESPSLYVSPTGVKSGYGYYVSTMEFNHPTLLICLANFFFFFLRLCLSLRTRTCKTWRKKRTVSRGERSLSLPSRGKRQHTGRPTPFSTRSWWRRSWGWVGGVLLLDFFFFSCGLILG